MARVRPSAAPALTHPERVVDAASGLRKADVAAYYEAVAPWLLPQVAGRPLSLLRCPDGVGAACFFQRHFRPGFGPGVRALALPGADGEGGPLLAIDDARGLQALVQMNVLELHPWGARAEAPDRPDRVVFDLDPDPALPWAQVRAAAVEVREALAARGLRSWVRLTGGKGVHVVAPFAPGPGWSALRAFCRALAQALQAAAPQRYATGAARAARGGRIYLDWQRNARGASSVAGWSLRARPRLPVAMPLHWDELAECPGPAAYDLPRARQRAQALARDPWDGFAQCRQALPAA